MANWRGLVEIVISAKNQFKAAFAELKSDLGGIASSLTSVDGLMRAVFGAAVAAGIMKVVAAFAEEEAAIIRLNTQLRVSGRYTEDGTRAIQAMAGEMQKLTTVTDESAIQISAIVGELANQLTTEQLAQVQKAVIGISHTTGKGLEETARAVGRTIGTETNALRRSGVQIDVTGTQVEKFNQIMALTANRFEMAKGATESLNGILAQAKNQFGEIMETVGGLIVHIFGLHKAGEGAQSMFEKWNETLKSNAGRIINFVQRVGLSFALIGKTAVALVTTVIGTAIALFHGLGAAIGAIAGTITVGIIKLINIGVIKPLNAIFKAADTAMGLFGGSLEFRIEEIATTGAWDMMNDQAEKAALAVGVVAEEWKNVGRAMDAVAKKGAEETPGLPDQSTAGGGENLNQPVVAAGQTAKGLVEEVKSLVAEFKNGEITAAEFAAKVEVLRAQLLAMKAVTTDRKDLAALNAAINALGDATVKAAEALARTDFAGFINLLKTLPAAQQAIAINSVFKNLKDDLQSGAINAATFDERVRQLRDTWDALGLRDAIGLPPPFDGWLGFFDQIQFEMENMRIGWAETIEFSFGVLQNFAAGAVNAFSLITLGSKQAGNAFQKSMTAAIGVVAKVLSGMYFVMGINEIAKGIAGWPKGHHHFAAAAKHFEASAKMASVAGSAGGGGGGTGGGGGGGSVAPPAVAQQPPQVEQQEAVIVIQGGFINTGDPRQVDELQRAIEAVARRRTRVEIGS